MTEEEPGARGVRASTVVLAAAVLVAAAVFAVVLALQQPRLVQTSRPAEAVAETTEAPLVPVDSFPRKGERRLRNPLGIAADADRLYVAESDAGVVRVFSAEGESIAAIAVPVAAGVPRAQPGSLAFVAPGRLAVVDTAGKRVVVLSTAAGRGKLLGVAGGKGPGALRQPTAVAAVPDGMAIYDAADRSLKVYDANGRFVRRVDEGLRPSLTFVGGMALGGDRLYVADSNASRVVVLDGSRSDSSAVLPERFSLPRGLASWPGGVLVADPFAPAVDVFDLAGKLLGRADAPRGGRWSPMGVAWSAATGRVYVTDPSAGTVDVFEVRTR